MTALKVVTRRRNEFVDLTPQIRKAVNRAKVGEGMVFVFCPHTTAGLTINENADPAVQEDIQTHLQALIPANKQYSHSEGNADAHIKSSLVGSSVSLIIEQGNIVLGTWQGVYFCEFDGPRHRTIYLKIIQG